jgi:hypothetical protein
MGVKIFWYSNDNMKYFTDNKLHMFVSELLEKLEAKGRRLPVIYINPSLED